MFFTIPLSGHKSGEAAFYKILESHCDSRILYGLNLSIGKACHLQKEPAMPKSANIGASIGTVSVSDGNLNDLEVLFHGSEN